MPLCLGVGGIGCAHWFSFFTGAPIMSSCWPLVPAVRLLFGVIASAGWLVALVSAVGVLCFWVLRRSLLVMLARLGYLCATKWCVVGGRIALWLLGYLRALFGVLLGLCLWWSLFS